MSLLREMKTTIHKIRRRLKTIEWKIVSRLKANETMTFTLPDQSLFDYPLKSAIGCCLYRNSFEEKELKFFMSVLKPGDVFFDVGANGGLYSVIASKIVGEEGRVYAFEPGNFEIGLLTHNIQLNSCENITIVDKAVGNSTGTVDFGISDDGAMNSLRKTEHSLQSIREWKPVQMIRLDDFFEQLAVKRVNFVKIDVEGAENLVFEGATKILSSGKPVTILFEGSDTTSSVFGYSVRDMITRIKALGFSVCYLDEDCNLVETSEDNPDIGKKLYNFVAKNW